MGFNDIYLTYGSSDFFILLIEASNFQPGSGPSFNSVSRKNKNDKMLVLGTEKPAVVLGVAREGCGAVRDGEARVDARDSYNGPQEQTSWRCWE